MTASVDWFQSRYRWSSYTNSHTRPTVTLGSQDHAPEYAYIQIDALPHCLYVMSKSRFNDMKTSTFLAALLAQCAYSSSVTKDKDGHCPPLPPQYHGAAIVEEIDLLYQNMTGPNKNGAIRMKAKGCENLACIHNSTIVTCNQADSTSAM